MQYNCLNILKSTEAHLKYTHDVSLKDASPQALHDALGRAVMMAISDNWTYAKQQNNDHTQCCFFHYVQSLLLRLIHTALQRGQRQRLTRSRGTKDK